MEEGKKEPEKKTGTGKEDKKEENKEEEVLRDESDLVAKDQNGRNILHRAAVEQQLDLI